jgi:ribose transport system substrate-binding protein
MFTTGTRLRLGSACLAACTLIPAACATTTASKENTTVGSSAQAGSIGPQGRPDITSLCGSKPLKVAMVDGFSGNAWREIARAEYEDEAGKCPNISSPQYLSANMDPQKYISIIDGLVAQDVDVIIGTNDFGSATLSALRRAHKAGVTVVLYNADPGGKVGEDYTGFVSIDYLTLVKEWADWLNKALKGKGDILYLGGPAGNPQDTKWLAALKKELARYPGIKLLQEGFLATQYDAASMQKAIAGALGKYGRIDGYVSSYGAAMTGAVRAYQNAGKPVPPIATVASSNEFICLRAKTNPRFEALSLDGTTYLPRIALRLGVAKAAGTADAEPPGYRVQPLVDSLAGKNPACNPSLPPDADLSSPTLTPDQLVKLLGH